MQTDVFARGQPFFPRLRVRHATQRHREHPVEPNGGGKRVIAVSQLFRRGSAVVFDLKGISMTNAGPEGNRGCLCVDTVATETPMPPPGKSEEDDLDILCQLCSMSQ